MAVIYSEISAVPSEVLYSTCIVPAIHQASGDSYTSMTLNHFFDTKRQNLIPRPKMTPLGGKYERILAVYDEVTGNLVLVDPDSGTVLPVPMNTVYDSVKDLKNRLTGRKEEDKTLRMLTDFAEDSKLLFFSPRGRTIQLVDISSASSSKVELPFMVSSLHPLSESQYLLVR